MSQADLTSPDLTRGGLREGETGGLHPLYLRFERTTDRETLQQWPDTIKQDVVAYRDEAMTDRAAVWPWFLSTRPRKGSRTVTLNCYRWRPVWKPALKEKSENVENSA